MGDSQDEFSPIETSVLNDWAKEQGVERLRHDAMRPRALTARPRPRYAYLPGRDPHPRRDAAGHSFDVPEHELGLLSESEWSRHFLWPFGVDLYNEGYFWECHESFEALWHALGHVGRDADLLKGLIKAAAAHLKAFDQKRIGPWTLAFRASEELRGVLAEPGDRPLPMDLATFVEDFDAWFEALRQGKCLPSRFPYIRGTVVRGSRG